MNKAIRTLRTVNRVSNMEMGGRTQVGWEQDAKNSGSAAGLHQLASKADVCD